MTVAGAPHNQLAAEVAEQVVSAYSDLQKVERTSKAVDELLTAFLDRIDPAEKNAALFALCLKVAGGTDKPS